jgi:hypothetical protein
MNRLQQAFEPADKAIRAHPSGPPSFRRWAGIEGPNPRPFDMEAKKYLGGTLFGLRVVIHNRRTDGKAIGLYLPTQTLLTNKHFEGLLLPEQKVNLNRTQISS